VVDGIQGEGCASINTQNKGRIVGFQQYQTREGTFDGRSLGIPNLEEQEILANTGKRHIRGSASGELYVEAGKPFLLSYLYNEYVFGNYRGCSFALSFTPQKDKDYEARFWLSREKRCVVALTMRMENGQWLPVPREAVDMCTKGGCLQYMRVLSIRGLQAVYDPREPIDVCAP
jgi:hypothetical protein